MSKSAPDASLDPNLDEIATCTQMDLVSDSSTPTNLTNSLASVSLTPGDGNGDFTIADGDSGGRKLTITAKPGTTVTTPGTARHVVLSLSGTIKYVTTCVETAIAGTVDIPAWKITFGDPA